MGNEDEAWAPSHALRHTGSHTLAALLELSIFSWQNNFLMFYICCPSGALNLFLAELFPDVLCQVCQQLRG